MKTGKNPQTIGHSYILLSNDLCLAVLLIVYKTEAWSGFCLLHFDACNRGNWLWLFSYFAFR